MKNLAEFKRLIKPGVNVHIIHHQAFAGRGPGGEYLLKDEDRGTRPVSISQNNQFALATQRDGKTIDSWIQYPKAKFCVFNKDGSVTIYDKDFSLPADEQEKTIKLITLRIV